MSENAFADAGCEVRAPKRVRFRGDFSGACGGRDGSDPACEILPKGGQTLVYREEHSVKETSLKRLLALALAVLTLVGTVIPVAADSTGTKASSATGTGTPTYDFAEIYDVLTYSQYRAKYASADRGAEAITIQGADYDPENTTAEVDVYTDYDGAKGDALLTPVSGRVSWEVEIPQAGKYAIKLKYYPLEGTTTAVERKLYINGEHPFDEMRGFSINKVWKNNYLLDENGNPHFERGGNSELRPTASQTPEWLEASIIDSNGYYVTPFEFYFAAGTSMLTLEGVRETMLIESITLYPYEDLPSYDEMLAEYQEKGYKEASMIEGNIVKIQAEYPTAMSHSTIYPINDRTSAITEPQDSALSLLNVIGEEQWTKSGQWLRWEVTVAEDGLYTIGARFKQALLNGLYTSRRLRIDGEIPFAEANNIRFSFDKDWQYEYLGDDNRAYQFYLTAGTHTLELEVTLGDMGNLLDRVQDTVTTINNAYLEILKLTGPTPDEYRDYGFARLMPDTIKSFFVEANELEAIIKELETMNGIKGSTITTLEQIAILLKKMGTNEDEIAKNLSNLKSYIGNLGTWISDVQYQYLTLDFLTVQPASAEKPQANASFWESFKYEIAKFFVSFFTDYNTLAEISAEDYAQGNVVDVWAVTGRDEAQITRTLIENDFTAKTGVKVNLKLTAGGTLLPSVLAGNGPDVSLGEADVINYAIRGAVLPLNGYDTFDEVMSRFSPSATIPLSLYGETYAVPVTQSFPMLFYRKDILNELGLDVPKTWDDLMEMVPILQYNNMDIGMSQDYKIYLYQMGGDLWADEGMRINLDENLSLEAFEMMCNMFTQYSMPLVYDFSNRFRTGEMPIAIQDYTTYNQLIVFATEIAGLWNFAPIPGMVDDEGNIDNTAVSAVGGITMMSGADNCEGAWDFMDWYVDKDFQVSYSNERVALLGESAKHPTANIEALKELSWTADELDALMTQFNNLAAIPSYPGSYIIDRYTGFAFKAAYNDKADPTDELLSYINTINKEINRKREEFGLETLELGQTLAEKRAAEAAAAGN